MLPWKCHSGHIMELCDECNNCTKFKLYTEKVVRDIKFFVILHHFVKFFVSLFQRAFKMMKNGVYFIVIALLVAELFKILIYAN